MITRLTYVRTSVACSWLALIAASLGAGCSQLPRPTADELARGYVLFLPGVSTDGTYMAKPVAGLRDGGVDQAIEVKLWGTRPLGTLTNLTAYEANREEARRLAEGLVAYRAEYPNAPISIIGYSGGAGVAVFTAESLPETFQLDRVVLIAAAISPRYDLSPVIHRCRRNVVNFYSEQDWMQLGWGTRTFGTMDRQNTMSAGYIGFRNPNDRILLREGLEQVPWRSDWWKLGHGGNHAGWLARAWAREVLAPVVRLDPPASQPTAASPS